MKRSLISYLTLTGALVLSTAAFSQTMIDGKAVSGTDMPKVQAACDALAKAGDGPASADANKTGANAASSGAGDAAAKADAGANATASGGFDVSTLTLDQCKTAGLVKTP